MKKYALPTVVFILAISGLISPADACRFWVANNEQIDAQIVKRHLLEAPHSLKNLGNTYKDGWSVSIYMGTTALVTRSEKPSISDDRFDVAVNNAAELKGNIVIGHLRRASSGCKEGVANPHPFQRFHNRKNWLFGHNGGLNKDLLIKLIGDEYLREHPPVICNENPPDSWVDSELYFIYLLKKIDEADENVRKGLETALKELSDYIEEDNQYLNFFLADGKYVWAFRKGSSLFYAYDDDRKISLIASTDPGDGLLEWKEFPEDTLALLRPHRKPKFYDLKK